MASEEVDYTSTISMRLPITMLKEFDAMCRNSKVRIAGVEKIFSDRTEAFKTLAGIGLFIEKNKQQIAGDPNFVDKLNQMIANESYMEWFEKMSPTQLQALKELIIMKQEGKQVKIA